MCCYIFHSFLFNNLCSGIVGTGVVQPVDMLGFEVSGNHFGECYVARVLRDVTWLAVVGWAEQRSGCKSGL